MKRRGVGTDEGYLTAGSNLGTAMDTGDVDADGYPDLVITTPGENVGAGRDRGRVELWLGGPGGLGRSRADAVQGGADGAELGITAAVGDLDGDGAADIVAALGTWQVARDKVSVWYGQPP